MKTAEKQAIFSYEDLSSRCLGNVELIERVIDAFTDGFRSDLKILRDAIHDDLDLVSQTAHRVKGSSANAAAHRMSSYAAALERDAKNGRVENLNELCIQLARSFEEFMDARQQRSNGETETPN